jgi:hypothetical protein
MGGCRGVEHRLIINLRESIESVRGVNGWLNYPRLSLDLKSNKQERKAFTRFQELNLSSGSNWKDTA